MFVRIVGSESIRVCSFFYCFRPTFLYLILLVQTRQMTVVLCLVTRYSKSKAKTHPNHVESPNIAQHCDTTRNPSFRHGNSAQFMNNSSNKKSKRGSTDSNPNQKSIKNDSLSFGAGGNKPNARRTLTYSPGPVETVAQDCVSNVWVLNHHHRHRRCQQRRHPSTRIRKRLQVVQTGNKSLWWGLI